MVRNKVLTLAFVHEKARILLGLKKRGFGMGRWNGFGGKVQSGETIVEAAKRELKEESGLDVEELNPIGILMFEFVGDPQLLEVHVFETSKYCGTPTESEEMRPQWYSKDDIPFGKMWPDDILWFPYMKRNVCFYGYFTFEGMDKIISHTLKEVPSVDSVNIPQEAQHTKVT